MKLKLLFSLFAVFLMVNTAVASFPVKRNVVIAENVDTIDSAESIVYETPFMMKGYDKWVAVAFWFFLGAFAAHRWYAKKPIGWNILFIVTLGGLGIWAIVDIINILTDNFQ